MIDELDNLNIVEPAAASNMLNIKVICGITGFFFVVEIVFGIYTGSLALQADAFHMASDFIAILMTMYSIKVKNKIDKNYNYGLVNSEIIGGFANTLFLLSSCIFLFLECIHRTLELMNNEGHVENIDYVIIVGFIGLLVNIFSIAVLHLCDEGHERSQNIKGLMLHIMGDLLGSIAIIIGSFIMYNWNNWGGDPNSRFKYIFDPIITLLILILIIKSSRPLLMSCLDILTFRVSEEMQEVRETILSDENIIEIMDLKLWKLNNDYIICSAKIKYRNYNGDSVMNTKNILNRFKIYDITIEGVPDNYLACVGLELRKAKPSSNSFHPPTMPSPRLLTPE